MIRFSTLARSLIFAFAISACSSSGGSLPVSNGQPSAQALSGMPAGPGYVAQPACPGSRIAQMQCDLLIEKIGVSPDVAGLTPADFQKWYNLPSSSKGSHEIVAIVDAFDNPNVASDLATYRSYFGLPTADFHKYNQDGQESNYPKPNKGWGGEIDLDVQMVSASCPNCTIYLIEAKNNGNALNQAEIEAVKLGAHIISNSWGGGRGGASGGIFDKRSVTYLASAGDSGYGMQDPADYTTVVSVGGTVLSQSGSSYTESVWKYSGGGCSVVAKPKWQDDPKCKNRTGNDVAAVAWNTAMYDSYGYRGWLTAGGTSVASPLTAGVFALAGNARKQDGGRNFWRLPANQRSSDLHYISSGDVVHCPTRFTGTYLCKAGTNQFGNYSSPAGWGSPNGIGAF